VGLLENVRPHQSNRFLLKLDFNNFFPSIKSSDFERYLHDRIDIDPKDVEILSRILFKFNRTNRMLELSIGAPSSPLISNIMLFEFDSVISEFCSERKITYTRYADDISFSTNTPGILRDCKNFVETLLRDLSYPTLTLNSQKTVETSTKRGRRITGLTITGDGRVSVGRERKRELRAQIHRFTQGTLNSDELEQLRGYMSFLISVEPEHVERLKKSFGESVISAIVHSRNA
jgi:RNA-directed DNA polymerase